MSAAKKNEIEDLKDVTFEFAGNTYTVPAPKMWPIEVIEAEENGQQLGALKALVGDEQYKTLRKTLKVMKDIEECMSALFDAVDVDKGE